MYTIIKIKKVKYRLKTPPVQNGRDGIKRSIQPVSIMVPPEVSMKDKFSQKNMKTMFIAEKVDSNAAVELLFFVTFGVAMFLLSNLEFTSRLQICS